MTYAQASLLRNPVAYILFSGGDMAKSNCAGKITHDPFDTAALELISTAQGENSGVLGVVNIAEQQCVNFTEQPCMNHCYMQRQGDTQTHTAEPKQNMKVYVLLDYNNETRNIQITLWK